MNNGPLERPKKRWPLAGSVNEIVVTLWSCASFYLMFATGGQNQFVLFIPLIVGAIALVGMTYRRPVIAKVDPVLSGGVFLLIFSILASYLFNSQRFEPIVIAGNLASTVLLFVALYTITTKMDLDLRKTLVFQCVFSIPLLPFVLATSTMQWGRVMPAELTPNYVGMMAMLSFIGACSTRSLFSILALSALPVYAILVMESRDSILSAGIAGLILLGYYLRSLGWRKVRPYAVMAFLGGPIVCIALYFLGVDLFGYIYGVFDGLFLISDEHRGIGSGGSGRTDLWSAAIDLWITHPIFGVGFKGHQAMMPDQMLAHNAYLGMLAELGIVGFVSYLIIVGVGVYRTFQRGQRGLFEYPQRVAILISYLIYGMLESRAFGFGNSYSLLFLLVVFDSSKHRIKAPVTTSVMNHGPAFARRDAARSSVLVAPPRS